MDSNLSCVPVLPTPGGNNDLGLQLTGDFLRGLGCRTSIRREHEPVKHKSYGRFCGSTRPAIVADMPQKIMASIKRIKPFDDLDVQCRIHDICYLDAAKHSTDALDKMRDCDRALYAAVSPMAKTFARREIKFSEIHDEAFWLAYTNWKARHKKARELQKLHPNWPKEKIVDAVDMQFKNLDKIAMLAEKGHRLYERCKIVAESIVNTVSNNSYKNVDPRTKPLRLALRDFAWIPASAKWNREKAFAEAVRNPDEKCDKEIGGELLKILTTAKFVATRK